MMRLSTDVGAQGLGLQAILRSFCLAVITAATLLAGGCVTTPTTTSFAGGGSSGKSALGVLPKDNREQEIFMQAVGTGALVGAGIGALIADRAGSNAALGGAIGGLVGAAAGKIIADQQVKNLRDVTLQADELEKVLDSARQYNEQVAEYNDGLEREIVRLSGLESSERSRLAQVQKRDAELSRQNMLAQKQSRQQIASSLSSEQRASLRAEERVLDAEIRRNESLIQELNSFSEPARIGSEGSRHNSAGVA